MARHWRAYHPDLVPVAGSRLTLVSDEAHHVARVLRLEAGEGLNVFDGRGTEWQAKLVETSVRRVVVELQAPVTDPVEATLELVLFQGLCKTDRMEWVIQKATELGVAAIRPLGSRSEDARMPDSRRLERWRRITIEACKQSGRRRLPAIEVADELPHPPGETLALMLDPAANETLGSLLDSVSRPETVWMAIGPEIGFNSEETALGLASGWHRVGLGPRILRTETAGLVAAAILLHHWSDLGALPRC